MLLLFRILSILIVLAGLMPIIKNTNWAVRIFDYPRFQKLIFTFFLLIFWAVMGFEIGFNFDSILVLALLGNVALLVHDIYPFTPFGSKMVEQTIPGEVLDSKISVLVTNVLQNNTHYQKVTDIVNKVKPDVVFLVETDKTWELGLQELDDLFEFQIKIPQDNTYGMLFYSKFEIKAYEIHHLIDDAIPSLEVDLILRSGELVKIYAIHPTPPVPGENPRSTERDSEILLVGQKAKSYGDAALVIGDMNDVGWSYTSELFLKTSGFLDPRRGRGMYNTFNAKYFFLRWPLDHIFISKHFTLDKIKVEHSVGSDHFPISGIFTLQPSNGNEKMDSDPNSEKEAKKKINEGKTE